MSEDKFSAKFEVKPSTIPDRLRNDLENVKHPSAIKLLPVARKNESSGTKGEGLSMMELCEFVNDPFWVKIRRTLLCLIVLLFITIFIVSLLIIINTPPCESLDFKFSNTSDSRNFTALEE